MKYGQFVFNPLLLKIITVALMLIVVSPLSAQTMSTLDEVVVTASRTEERTRELSSNVTVIDEEKIQLSTAQTLSDILVEQGFNVVSTNDTAGVQIRGFGSLSLQEEHTNTVLILLNGRRTGNANATLVGLANVERIEIIRGPSAVQYGSSAMGGVINIITKRGSEKPLVSFELGMGSDQLKREKFTLSGAKKGFDFALGVTNYERGDLTTESQRRWYHTKIDNNSMVDADLGYSFNPEHRVGFHYYFGNIKSELASGSGIRPYSANTPDAPFTSYEKHTNNTAFSYTGNTKDKVFDWMAHYSFGNYDQEPYANYLDTKFFNVQTGYNGSLVAASVGLDHYIYEADNVTAPDEWSMSDTGIYATGKLRLFEERLVFSAGLRYDAYTNESATLDSSDDSNVGVSVGVAYVPQRWLKLRSNYAEGFKMPSPQQVGGDGAYFYLPNPDLKPEKSKTFEFGGDIDWNHVTASLTWFHSDWENKVTALMAPGNCAGGYGCYQYQNLKSSTLAGLESSLSTDVIKVFGMDSNLEPYVSFTWLHTRKNNDSSQHITYNGNLDDTLPNTPDWMVSYGIRYVHPGYRIKSRLNASYYGAVLSRDFSTTGSPYISRPTGTVVNLSAEKELVQFRERFGALTLRAEINNIFDGTNEVYWGYPGAGRSFYMGLRYNFD